MSADASSANDDASLKRKHEEIASNTTDEDSEDDDARIPKPLDHFPEEVRAVIMEKFTEIRALSTICARFTSEEDHDRFSEMMADTVRQAIEECPDIVRVAYTDGYPPYVDNNSLLHMLCSLPSDERYPFSLSRLFVDAIKVAIEKNPFALRWPDGATIRGNFQPECLFNRITYNEYHSRLLPWIIENYGHILCSGCLQQSPLHFDLVCSYAEGFCDASTVRTFYETHPDALKQLAKGDMNDRLEDGIDEYIGKGYPLHYAMHEQQPDQEDYDLFEWMIEQNPEALQHQDPLGRNILHQIFMTYQGAPRVYPNYANTVIDASPVLVFVKDKKGKYAAHYLSSRSAGGNGHSWIDDFILVRLLRRMFAAKLIDDELRADPFVAGIEKVLETQHQLSLNSVQIRRVEMMVNKAIAVKSGDTSVLSEVKEVYGDWSQKHLPAIKAAITNSMNEDIPSVRSETRGRVNESSEEEDDSSREDESDD